jgi:hypothetical protein
VRLVTTCVMLAALALAPRAARAGSDEQEYAVDVSGALDERGLADVDAAVGPVTFGQIIVQDAPTARELERAGERERTRPRPVLVISNAGPRAAELALEVRLEDEAGQSFMSCTFKKTLKQSWNELIHHACTSQDMNLKSWPQVRRIRVVGTVRI